MFHTNKLERQSVAGTNKHAARAFSSHSCWLPARGQALCWPIKLFQLLLGLFGCFIPQIPACHVLLSNTRMGPISWRRVFQIFEIHHAMCPWSWTFSMCGRKRQVGSWGASCLTIYRYEARPLSTHRAANEIHENRHDICTLSSVFVSLSPKTDRNAQTPLHRQESHVPQQKATSSLSQLVHVNFFIRGAKSQLLLQRPLEQRHSRAFVKAKPPSKYCPLQLVCSWASSVARLPGTTFLWTLWARRSTFESSCLKCCGSSFDSSKQF